MSAIIPCTVCPQRVEPRTIATLHGSVALPAPHLAPCGLPCVGGSVNPRDERHGAEWCPRCGWLRVVPEVAEELRRRALLLLDSPRPVVRRLATDLLRAADEVAKLRAELDQAHRERDEARHERDALRMQLDDARYDEETDRGRLINALASAGARRVEAEEALARCGSRPERVAEAERLRSRVASEQEEERRLRDMLAMLDGERVARAEREAAEAACATEGHKPGWCLVDYWSSDYEYRCTRCGKLLDEEEMERDQRARILGLLVHGNRPGGCVARVLGWPLPPGIGGVIDRRLAAQTATYAPRFTCARGCGQPVRADGQTCGPFMSGRCNGKEGTTR